MENVESKRKKANKNNFINDYCLSSLPVTKEEEMPFLGEVNLYIDFLWQ
jgi:hypothetical protein